MSSEVSAASQGSQVGLEPRPHSRVEPAPLVSLGRVKLLALLPGLAHLTILRDRAKGLIFLAMTALFAAFMVMHGGTAIENLITLGHPQPELPIRERENSLFMMIDGVMIVVVILIFLAMWFIAFRSAVKTAREINLRGHMDAKQKSLSHQLDRAFPVVGLTPTFIMIAFFVVVPLVFSALVAFTNYSRPNHLPPGNTIDWVGFDNFQQLFGGDHMWTGAVGRVAIWTVVWAFLATGTTYIGGMLMAVILANSRLRITPFFRAIFILPYAVPGVVSLLVWRNMLNGAFGTLNRTLEALPFFPDVINTPWLTDPMLARFTMVIINLWVGFPYFML
ncbi:MAG: sugar ABC transporter permease, partial [Promicromonosporaceae bacterium]|nr:sugar ABC transporter permease [Promicromonosporaceae bacterium]